MRSRSNYPLYVPRARSGFALTLGVIAFLLMAAAPQPVRAADPLLTVTKDTLLGAVTGLVLGGTLTLVISDGDKQADTVRWGVVIGTFGGFVFGVYHATQGDQPLFADRQVNPDSCASKLQLTPSAPRTDQGLSRMGTGGKGPGYPSERPRPMSTETGHGWSLRFSLLKMSW